MAWNEAKSLALSAENEGINPPDCQDKAECCKTSNLVGSHQWQDPEFLGAALLEARRRPTPAAVPEEIDVAANAAATSGDGGGESAAEVARHDGRRVG